MLWAWVLLPKHRKKRARSLHPQLSFPVSCIILKFQSEKPCPAAREQPTVWGDRLVWKVEYSSQFFLSAGHSFLWEGPLWRTSADKLVVVEPAEFLWDAVSLTHELSSHHLIISIYCLLCLGALMAQEQLQSPLFCAVCQSVLEIVIQGSPCLYTEISTKWFRKREKFLAAVVV